MFSSAVKFKWPGKKREREMQASGVSTGSAVKQQWGQRDSGFNTEDD